MPANIVYDDGEWYEIKKKIHFFSNKTQFVHSNLYVIKRDKKK